MYKIHNETNHNVMQFLIATITVITSWQLSNWNGWLYGWIKRKVTDQKSIILSRHSYKDKNFTWINTSFHILSQNRFKRYILIKDYLNLYAHQGKQTRCSCEACNFSKQILMHLMLYMDGVYIGWVRLICSVLYTLYQTYIDSSNTSYIDYSWCFVVQNPLTFKYMTFWKTILLSITA